MDLDHYWTYFSPIRIRIYKNCLVEYVRNEAYARWQFQPFLFNVLKPRNTKRRTLYGLVPNTPLSWPGVKKLLSKMDLALTLLTPTAFSTKFLIGPQGRSIQAQIIFFSYVRHQTSGVQSVKKTY